MEETSEGSLWSVIKNFFTGRSENTIENLITEAKNNNELGPTIAKLLLNVLMLDQRQVREIMIPRPDIDCVEENSSIPEVARMILENGHSRVPVFRNNKDNIIGILHAKDLLNTQCNEGSEYTLTELMREPVFVPDTKNIKNMLF
ncbi:MAG: CBS domain-containing protein, partial [Thermodesulfobacteriota bacterium]